MYGVSPRFLLAIRDSGKRKTVVDFYNGTAPVLTDVPVIGGSITVDRNSRSRRSGSLILGDPSLFPKTTADFLAPYGIEIRIRTGVVYSDGTEELVPLGVFLLNDISASEAGGMVPSVDFFDRAQRVFETSTHVVEGGHNVIGGTPFAGSPVHDCLESTLVYPAPNWASGSPLWSLTIHITLGNPRVPGGMFMGDTDRWKMATDLAEMIGGEVYFNVQGNAVVNPIPSITTATGQVNSVFELNSGEDGVLVDVSQHVTREETYNSVVMLGATPGNGAPQPIGKAFDLVSTSKTYWEGLFGKKTLRVSNNKLTNNTDCQYAAEQILKNVLGIAKNVDFGGLANPALDGGDVITVTYSDGTKELHIIDSYTMDFATYRMSGTTRSIQLAVA
jgi:hypothetical protein